MCSEQLCPMQLLMHFERCKSQWLGLPHTPPLQALQNVRAVRGGLSTAATSSLAASLVLAALLPPALFWPLPIPPLPLPGAGGRARAASAPLLLLSAALAAGLAGQALGRLEEELTYTDYRHATK